MRGGIYAAALDCAPEAAVGDEAVEHCECLDAVEAGRGADVTVAIGPAVARSRTIPASSARLSCRPAGGPGVPPRTSRASPMFTRATTASGAAMPAQATEPHT
jgi:hypothetical protein